MSETGKTILLVDDEPSQLRQMHAALRKEGYHVLVAGDYDAAVNTHQRRQRTIHLLVTDLSLSGKNGFELAKTLLEGDPNLKVLFTSGIAGAELRKFQGLPDDRANFMDKPFTPADLVQRVRCMLGANGSEIVGSVSG